MRLYHRTQFGDAILTEGFRDAEGSWGMPGTYVGVWVSADDPVDLNEGAEGDDVLLIEVPEAVVAPYEVIEEHKPYREFLVPAAILNSYPVQRVAG
jgi:hypothetical protein